MEGILDFEGGVNRTPEFGSQLQISHSKVREPCRLPFSLRLDSSVDIFSVDFHSVKSNHMLLEFINKGLTFYALYVG